MNVQQNDLNRHCNSTTNCGFLAVHHGADCGSAHLGWTVTSSRDAAEHASQGVSCRNLAHGVCPCTEQGSSIVTHAQMLHSKPKHSTQLPTHRFAQMWLWGSRAGAIGTSWPCIEEERIWRTTCKPTERKRKQGNSRVLTLCYTDVDQGRGPASGGGGPGGAVSTCSNRSSTCEKDARNTVSWYWMSRTS